MGKHHTNTSCEKERVNTSTDKVEFFQVHSETIELIFSLKRENKIQIYCLSNVMVEFSTFYPKISHLDVLKILKEKKKKERNK